MAVFLMAAPGMPHRRLYYNAIGSLLLDQTIAQAFARTSLMQMILDALGFYVFNHNVWYAEKLGLTVEQLRAHQRALVAAGLDQTSAPILAVTGAVGTLINPAIGVIIVVLNEIGKLLLTEFIQPRPDSPKPLFLRIPDPNVCRDSPEAQAGSYLCPEGTTGAYPNCVTAPPARCPEGTTGTPPNCVPIPGTTPPARCPEGTTGTPPNCTPVSRGVRCPDGSFARTPGECPNGGGGGGGGGDVKGGGGGLLIGAAALLLLSRFLR